MKKLRKLSIVLLVFSLFCLALPFVSAQNRQYGSNYIIGPNYGGSAPTPTPVITSSPTPAPTATPTSPPSGGNGSGNEGGNNPTPTPITTTHPTATSNLNQPSNNYDYTPILIIGAIGVFALIVMNKKKRR